VGIDDLRRSSHSRPIVASTFYRPEEGDWVGSHIGILLENGYLNLLVRRFGPSEAWPLHSGIARNLNFHT